MMIWRDALVSSAVQDTELRLALASAFGIEGSALVLSESIEDLSDQKLFVLKTYLEGGSFDLLLSIYVSDAVITPRNAAETLAESLQTGLLMANDETSDPYSMIWMNGHGQAQEVRVVPLDLDERGIYNLESPVVAEQAGRDATRRLRCAGGEQCVRSGFWFTPAKAGSRQYFSAGDLMPEVTSDYGATIWQWDQNQESSKP
jgi:hypothetical protein